MIDFGGTWEDGQEGKQRRQAHMTSADMGHRTFNGMGHMDIGTWDIGTLGHHWDITLGHGTLDNGGHWDIGTWDIGHFKVHCFLPHHTHTPHTHMLMFSLPHVSTT